MGDEIRASVQYNDMSGTIAIGGWDRIGAIRMGAGIGATGYWPVGIEISQQEPRGRAGSIPDPTVYLLLVDNEILAEPGAAGVEKYAKRMGDLPVFRYATTLKVADLLPLLKRIDIVLQDRATLGVPLYRAGDDTIYSDEPSDNSELDDEEE